MEKEICKNCGHEYQFHDVLDNEACHLMDCNCKGFKKQKIIKMKEEICKNCGKKENEHWYYYKACYNMKERRNIFEPMKKLEDDL